MKWEKNVFRGLSDLAIILKGVQVVLLRGALKICLAINFFHSNFQTPATIRQCTKDYSISKRGPV